MNGEFYDFERIRAELERQGHLFRTRSDRRKIVAPLDSVPTMDPATRTRADTLLMWVLSICLLHDRLGMSSGAVARAA